MRESGQERTEEAFKGQKKGGKRKKEKEVNDG
jgi:hypothetical protein